MLSDLWILFEIGFCSFSAISNLLAVDVIPIACLLDKAELDAEVHRLPFFGNALAVDDIQVAALKWRGDFVFDDFHTDGIADDVGAEFDGVGATDIQTDGGVEFQGSPTGGRFWVSIHHADFLTKLVDENDEAVGFA